MKAGNLEEQMDAKTPLWTKNFITIIIVNLVVFFGFQMLMPTLPKYIKSIGIDNSMIGIISGIFTVSTLLIRPFAGQILDKIGRKQVLWLGLIIFIIMVASYSWLPAAGLLLLFRFLHGFGWGASTTAFNTIASDIIPKKRFGEGMGYFSLASSIAMATAPGAALYLLSKYNFRFITYFSAVLVMTGLFISFTLKYKTISKSENLPKEKAPLYEKTSVSPAIITFFVCITYGGITSFMSLYAAEKGIQNIGIFFTIYALFLLFSRPVFGKIVDFYGFNYSVISGLICIIIAMILLSIASTLSIFSIAASLYGIGFGATQSSLQTMALVNISQKRFGAANATYFTGFDSGIGFGTVIAGIIASKVGYGQMYLSLGLSAVIAGILYFMIGKKDRIHSLH